jgi:hypothetical protein
MILAASLAVMALVMLGLVSVARRSATLRSES